MFDPDSKAARAKQALDINDLWRHYNLPGSPAKSCCSPFREDKRPSFSVSEDGKSFFDYSNRSGGDCYDFIGLCEGISANESVAVGIRLAGLPDLGPGESPPPQPVKEEYDHPPLEIRHLLRSPSEQEVQALLDTRKLPISDATKNSLEMLESRKMLAFMECIDLRPEGEYADTCWVVKDETLTNAQVRRLDGEPMWVGGKDTGHWVKAKTLAGSKASWPLGLRQAKDCRHILIVEGGPDLLAAACLVAISGLLFDEFGFICLTGAGNSFPVGELEHLNLPSKKITAFSHQDMNRAGQKASDRWIDQLRAAGATDVMKWRPVDIPGVKDLNDALSQNNPKINDRLIRLISR